MYFFIPHPSIRCVQPALFTLGACQCNVERLEAALKKCKGGLAFWEHLYPVQEVDGAEHARELARGAESGE